MKDIDKRYVYLAEPKRLKRFDVLYQGSILEVCLMIIRFNSGLTLSFVETQIFPKSQDDSPNKVSEVESLS